MAKLKFMCTGKYTMGDGDLGKFIRRISRVLGSDGFGQGACSCEIFSALGGRHPDDISAIEWPAVVLAAARPGICSNILQIWDESGYVNQLGDDYKVPEDMNSNWVRDWQQFYSDRLPITSPTGHAHGQPNTTPSDARDYAMFAFLTHELNPEWRDFSESDMARGIKRGGEWVIREIDADIDGQQHAQDVAFGLDGILYCGIGQLPRFTTPRFTINTLRRMMNPLSREYDQDEYSGTELMHHPELWSRYV